MLSAVHAAGMPAAGAAAAATCQPPTDACLAWGGCLQVCEVLHSTYPACTAPDPEDPLAKPFRAQAIISNPPTYG